VTFVTCPTDLVNASAASVWEMLTSPERYESWTGADLLSVSPPGRVRPGQRIEFRVRELGRWWSIHFEVGRVNEGETLELAVFMPLGIINHEVVVLTPLDDSHTRLTFN
jgi:uncharacterized protein YndB with AHSA1/START domain